MYLTASLSAAFRKMVPGTTLAGPFRSMAQRAEAGGLDAVWLGHGMAGAGLDPLPLAGSLIAVTRRIGLGAAWSTDNAEPFHVARVFATLDHLSAGRIAWLFGQTDDPELFRHRPRRTVAEADLRAAELIDVAVQLWDSWEDDAFLVDVPSGRFADPARVHPIHHAGAHFTVRGPLNVPRPPQGNPVLVQAVADGARPHPQAEILLVTPDQAAALKALPPNPDRRILIDMAPHAGEPMAATISDWLAGGLCDGVNIMADGPDQLARFIDETVPYLQAAGSRPATPAGTTMRDRFGLPRPRSRFAT